MKHAKLYCHYAFKGLAVSNKGQLKPCCVFNGEYAPSIYLKDGIEKYKNSEWLKNFQQMFIDGEKHPGCQLCWSIEEKQAVNENKILSRRQRIEQQEHNLDKNIDNKDFELLTLPFGNTCNLACRICGPQNSSKWISLKKQFENTNMYTIHNWIKDDKHVEDLYENTKEAIYVEFPGGEPLLVDVENHFKLLEKWIKGNQSNKMHLTYTTNMTLFPKKEWWEIWSKFKSVTIMGSLDDREERFEYNRYPAKWEDVYQNLKQYKDKTKKFRNISFQINCTVSIFTFLRVNEIFKFGIKNGLEPVWNFLESPFYFSPGVLYPYYDDIIENYGNTKILKKILKCYQTDYSNLLPITKKEIEKIDLQRNQNFQNIFPELMKYLY